MYFGGFSSKEDIAREFALPEGSLGSVTILCACYEARNWEGSAFVLFEQEGVLYEVNGSHCSCYGLEGQWEPEETDYLSLYHRCTNGRLGHAEVEEESFNAHLIDLIRKHWGMA